MPEPEAANPPAVPVTSPEPVAPEGEPQPSADEPRAPAEPAHEAAQQDRVYFLVAGATEGPTGAVDPDVVTRRAKKAMERLLRAAG